MFGSDCMKRMICCLFLIVNVGMYAQSPAKYWIAFTDKNNNGYSVDQPEAFLSKRALEKRKRFHIEITTQDLPLTKSYVNELLSMDTSMRLLSQSKWLNGISVYSQDENLIKKLENIPFVRYAEKTIQLKQPELACDSIYRRVSSRSLASALSKPSMPESLDLAYGKAEDQIKINRGHWLHRIGYLGESVQMGIFDGGFHNVDSIRHLEVLRNENRLLCVRNFVKSCEDPLRHHSHGTYVLSCIAADVPGELVGTAPKVSVCLALTEDGSSEHKIEEDNWVAALEWADSLGCDIINSSLGYTQFDDSTQRRTAADLTGQVSRASQAASIAASKGIIVCNSAGNAGRGPWFFIGCPADAKDIIAVGAVDRERNKTTFSSMGPSADGRVKPDACALGKGVYVANPYAKTTLADGTSFSSPLLAGMMACLWQAFPEKSSFEVMEAVRKSGSIAHAPDSLLGYGISDMWKAYNLLRKDEASYDEKGNLIMTLSLSSFVYEKEPLRISIQSRVKTKLTVQAIMRSNQATTSKTYKIKKGKNVILWRAFPGSQSDTYDFVDLRLQSAEVDYSYIIGVEKADKD